MAFSQDLRAIPFFWAISLLDSPCAIYESRAKSDFIKFIFSSDSTLILKISCVGVSGDRINRMLSVIAYSMISIFVILDFGRKYEVSKSRGGADTKLLSLIEVMKTTPSMGWLALK